MAQFDKLVNQIAGNPKKESVKNPESGAIKGTATYAIPAVEPIF